MEPLGVWLTTDGLTVIGLSLIFVMALQIWNGFQIHKLEKLMASNNQGLNDLNAAVAADTAEVQAEVAAFQALEAQIAALIAAGPGEVSDAQLEALAQSLQAAQAARVAAVAAAQPPAPSSDAKKA